VAETAPIFRRHNLNRTRLEKREANHQVPRGLEMTGERNLNERNDVIIVGAGPVGLLLANYLGAQGLDVTVLERLPQLIDYPRGVGMDDETLRAIQSAGLVEQILPHVSPYQVMHFTNGKGRIFASLDPHTDEFGWPRRNGFIQPLVDCALAEGLQRFPRVSLIFGATVGGLTETSSGVAASITLADGTQGTMSARYVVACDGGASATRKALGIGFRGATDSHRWIVVDTANDPIGTPGSFSTVSHRAHMFQSRCRTGCADSNSCSGMAKRLAIPCPNRCCAKC
jgi:3-(3-hydroxy-phenyl)propionate hydroxylase